MKKSKNMWNRFVNVVSGVGGVNEDDEFETDEYEDELEYEEERVPRRTPAVAPSRTSVNYTPTPARALQTTSATANRSSSTLKRRRKTLLNASLTSSAGLLMLSTAIFRRSARKSSSACPAMLP